MFKSKVGLETGLGFLGRLLVDFWWVGALSVVAQTRDG